MATVKFCDDCDKKDCKKRIAGGVCEDDKQLSKASKDVISRDPLLVAGKMTEIIGSEENRYKIAVENENVGELEVSHYTDKNGEVKTCTKKRKLDTKITTLALNILKGYKIVNEVINPQKGNALFQQNNQYNFVNNPIDRLNALPEGDKAKVIKFIDNKLDNDRQHA